MTAIATRSGEADQPRQETRALGLSGRLILLTMSFLMIAQIIVYVPGAVSFRRAWLSDRVMGAQMIALALAGTPNEARSPVLDARLLAGVKGAQAVGVRGQGTRWLLALPGEAPPPATLEIDLRTRNWLLAARGLVRNLFMPAHSTVRIVAPGIPGVEGVETVEIVLDETPLKRAILAFTRNFAIVSLAISAFTGLLLYWALHIMVVRPVRRLSGNITDFAGHPEDISRVIRPTGRTDEIGLAETALARMETILAGELRQKRHLADLGLAVSKINHELRNMLTTAQLLGDRLDEVEDPTVRRIAPRLVRTLARAIDFCGATLAYGRTSEPLPQRKIVPLKAVVEEQFDLTAVVEGVAITLEPAVPDGMVVDADPDQLARILLNLIRNAVEAHSRAETPNAFIRLAAERRPGVTVIRVEDNGPGVPDRIRDRLFSAFQASERAGGTGLGLPVADELVRLHGGTIVLERVKTGASFVVTIPDRPPQAVRDASRAA